ncbi:AAA family ATPase [Candidatus Halocynthiibacter alkanivorans]|uniref:AAA family ATPase n=1 Tax=Candidatus Halocynthiibacter alkanivorans TaxID=2267619 RepID=UPI000DF44CA1|nr:AAA family ATPase [Candidatus Halocynthiibacter alkanivorans]
MKLLALHLTNVRKFTGKRASITGIGSGITVVSEANEFGKSTFFDAIHALFFEKYSSSAKPVKSLQPYAGGAVEVAADVQTDQGAFRVEKRFLSRKSAKITRLSDGATVAQDDEAERWISALLGTANDGPAGLLWVRQGLVGLEPDSAKEKTQLKETRRDLLSSVAGEIDAMTGGRRMDRVMRRVADNLSEITTRTGRKAGAWKAASDEVVALETELASVTTQVQTLEKALNDRKQSEASLKRLDNADAKARRDEAFTAAKAAMEEARAHVGAVTGARQKRDLAELKATSAQSELDAILKAIDTLQAAEKQAKTSSAAADDAMLEAHSLKAALEAVQILHKRETEAVSETRKQLDVVRRQIVARKSQEEAAQLKRQITKAETVLGERDAARAITKASGATPDWLRRAEAAQGEVSKLNAVVEAQATTLSMTYDGAARVTRNGAIVPAGQPLALDGETFLDLPGIGRMTIHAQAAGEEGKTRLATGESALKDILSHAGAASLQEARRLATTRVEAETKADLAQAVLDTLAPNGIAALRTAKADADLAATGAHNEELPAIADLEAHLMQAEETEEGTQRRLNGTDAEYASSRETTVKLQAAADTAEHTLERANADAGPEDTRAHRRAERLRIQAQEQGALAKTEADLQAMIAAAPDPDTVAAELKRAEDTVTAARQERVQVGERLAALSSEIRTLAGNGIEEHRDELEGQLEAAGATEARFARQAAALTRLQAALDTERDAARDTYFGPVQEELKPLLSILHRDAVLSFDSESLLPTGLMRDQAEETLEDLSGGTKEQIAILTRLAFARLFARQGRHMPIILDDALVYSDDDRIIKMFTALTRVAQDQQILVFSCRQLAFQDLGGARPTVEIAEV